MATADPNGSYGGRVLISMVLQLVKLVMGISEPAYPPQVPANCPSTPPQPCLGTPKKIGLTKNEPQIWKLLIFFMEVFLMLLCNQLRWLQIFATKNNRQVGGGGSSN